MEVSGMMINLFGEVVSDEKPRPVANGIPQAVTWYIVASWYAPAQRWKIWTDQWLTREAAETKGKSRVEKVQGHTHFVVLEIKLPGD